MKQGVNTTKVFSIYFTFVNNLSQLLIEIVLNLEEYDSSKLYQCNLSIVCNLEMIIDFIEDFINVLENKAEKAILINK